MPLDEYIRMRLLGGTRAKHPVKNPVLLAKVLGMMDRKHLKNKFNQLVKTENPS